MKPRMPAGLASTSQATRSGPPKAAAVSASMAAGAHLAGRSNVTGRSPHAVALRPPAAAGAGSPQSSTTGDGAAADDPVGAPAGGGPPDGPGSSSALHPAAATATAVVSASARPRTANLRTGDGRAGENIGGQTRAEFLIFQTTPFDHDRRVHPLVAGRPGSRTP